MIAPRGSQSGAAACAGDATIHTTEKVARVTKMRRSFRIRPRSLARTAGERQAEPCRNEGYRVGCAARGMRR
jgi:hypothetical protein